ncbi:nicotinamide-nucleotide amidase [Neorhodopirellula lusitana]|uniref:Nicotinamide-nucleotide amidase n=1 Tax=Neorhodopirellula lusitana TaxID=445327 RepID=A0ABY1PNA2_9BACT|nr:CinA family protein [Neorhodopirellula lusitana]SMP38272.1 nicotinamide-nucleotide amidase [Neorhodopirellula lusitana]
MPATISPAAAKLIERLRAANQRIVFAESCTCGMAAAIVGGVPGASHAFGGSMVTYQAEVKQQWLNVDRATIHQFSAESQQTTDAMAIRLLEETPQADWAGAITGHLGPDAPTEKDGIVFVSLAKRGSLSPLTPVQSTFHLDQSSRIGRQIEAAERFLEWMVAQIE